jgi:threonine/homoserine/homoserine lactone efflux protein
MPSLETLLAFTAIGIGFVLSPGPNMTYLISRSISQGWAAGAISLAGIALAFALYLAAAVLGLTALALAVPYLYDAIRWIGAGYLLWLAWNAVRPGGHAPFEPRRLPRERAGKLLAMGLLTCLLNPKVAVFYASFLPQFVDPSAPDLTSQLVVLGLLQILISVAVNLVLILFAGGVATWFARHPAFIVVQRWLMGVVLAGLAVRLAFERR